MTCGVRIKQISRTFDFHIVPEEVLPYVWGEIVAIRPKSVPKWTAICSLGREAAHFNDGLTSVDRS